MQAPEHDHSSEFQHVTTPGGRAFLWGGIGLGVVLVLALLTHGFGLFGGRGGAGGGIPSLLRRGGLIFIPEGSSLRQRLTVTPAPAELQSYLITAPGIVEADPTRTVSVLPAGGGRVRTVKVALGDRVQRGQPLAVIDSPDLAQAYDDNDKAASSAALARKNLGYQEAQFKIGAASQRDLDEARNDHKQAEAEYARTRARLRTMGADEAARGANRLLTVRAPLSGSVTALSIAPGALINDDTQAIMSVADLSIVWVAALIAEKDLPAVARNQEAEVVVNAYAPKTLHGKVLFVPDVLEADSRRIRTRIAFAKP